MSEIDNMFVHLTNVAIQKHGVHLSILYHDITTVYVVRMNTTVVMEESGRLLTFDCTLRELEAKKYVTWATCEINHACTDHTNKVLQEMCYGFV